MTATRQLGTMSVASQTLLFVEGSLPEHAAEPEQPPVPREASVPLACRSRNNHAPPVGSCPAPMHVPSATGPRGPWQKKPPAANRPQPSPERRGREGKPSAGPHPAFGARPAFNARLASGSRPASGPRPALGSRPPSGSRPTPGPRPPFGRPHRPDTKPWQRRSSAPLRGREFRKEDRAGHPERSAPVNRPSFNRPARDEQRPPRADQRPHPKTAGAPPIDRAPPILRALKTVLRRTRISDPRDTLRRQPSFPPRTLAPLQEVRCKAPLRRLRKTRL